MKVNVSPYKCVEVRNIAIGDCFTFSSHVYMRVRYYTCPVDDNDIRVVNLSTGEVTNFGSKVAVHPVDCVVTNFTEDKKK